MSITKLRHESKDPRENQTHQTHQAKTILQDSTEKIRTLKNLNYLLFKETVDRRQQVESLQIETVGLELEMCVMGAFFETQMGEIGLGVGKMKEERDFEIGVLEKKMSELAVNLENERSFSSRVLRNRDGIKKDLEVLVGEVNELRENTIAVEKKERTLEEEFEKLKMNNERLKEEKMERERETAAAIRETDLVVRTLSVNSMREIVHLKRKIEWIARGKDEIEKEKSWQEAKICWMEKEIRELNEINRNLRKVEVKFLKLKESFGDTMEKENAMVMEINALEEEKMVKERNIEMLIDEKNSLKKKVETVVQELEERRREIEEIVKEKNEIEEVNVSQESDIVKLQEKVEENLNLVSALQKSSKSEEDKIKHLQVEIRCYKDAFDRVVLERNDAQKGFDEARQNAMNLSLKVAEMEKNAEKNKHIENLRAKVESGGLNLERALAMLKNTAAPGCSSKDGRDKKEKMVIYKQKIDDEFKPYTFEDICVLIMISSIVLLLVLACVIAA